MIAWFAFILALLALALTPSKREAELLEARLRALETRQCILMAVSTPTGTATICAEATRP